MVSAVYKPDGCSEADSFFEMGPPLPLATAQRRNSPHTNQAILLTPPVLTSQKA